MNKKSDQNLLVGLDIGTSKVVAIVADLTPEGDIDIIGIGSHPSIVAILKDSSFGNLKMLGASGALSNNS